VKLQISRTFLITCIEKIVYLSLIIGVSEKTEKLKEEFKRKLPKLQLNFYNEFYKLYDSGKWVQYSRTNTCWLKYLNILKGLLGTLSNNLEPPRKMRGSVSPNRSVLKRNQSRDINEPSQESKNLLI
jgi:hypothetical protein